MVSFGVATVRVHQVKKAAQVDTKKDTTHNNTGNRYVQVHHRVRVCLNSERAYNGKYLIIRLLRNGVGGFIISVPASIYPAALALPLLCSAFVPLGSAPN